jgi:polyhydroxybutyrate depolymerase
MAHFRIAVLAAALLLACGNGEGERGASNAGSGGETLQGMGGSSAGSGQTAGSDTLADTGIDSSGPSAGCGLASPAGGALTLDVDGREGQYLLVLPQGYDPARAYPLAFAFHGSNRTNEDCWLRDCLGFYPAFQPDAIQVYMRSFAAGWPDVAVREANVRFFSLLLAELKAGYCVDQGRVIVSGTSSGAHFSNILACRFGDQLIGTAPVAGTLMERGSCVGRVGALVVHGIDDDQVPLSDGEAARDYYVERNGCDATSMPPVAEVHTRIRASRDQMMSDSACADFQGCDQGYPVRWCEHSEGGYDNSTHGWPLVGGQLVHDFLTTL